MLWRRFLSGSGVDPGTTMENGFRDSGIQEHLGFTNFICILTKIVPTIFIQTKTQNKLGLQTP